MIDRKSSKAIAKALFMKMFPVPYKEVTALSLKSIPNDKISLFEKRIEYININRNRLDKATERLYKQKIRNYNQPYLESTLDFKIMEKESINWEINKYGKHYNRFPDSNYFIENPYIDGESEYYLMNKNIKVAKIMINNQTQVVTSIKEVYNPEYAPLECFKEDELNASYITSWFKGRGIPSWRDGLDDFLYNIGITEEISLLNRAFGLSLSDQYWMNPLDFEMDWHDINFFDHNFDSADYIDATFKNRIVNKDKVNIYSPNNTSDGMLKKAWITSNNTRYLLKASYKLSGFEPFSEVLAHLIAEVIKLQNVEYTIDYISDLVVSKCECFIDKDTELISAYAILSKNNIDLLASNPFDIYHEYIKILKTNGIDNPEISLIKMFILDYLIVNQDRHLGNFGIIRDVNNLKWLKLAPIYDSGQAMYSQKEVYEMDFERATGTFFNKKNFDFDTLIETITNNHSLDINFNELIKVADKWKDILYANSEKAAIDERRIESCHRGLIVRINKLKDIINK